MIEKKKYKGKRVKHEMLYAPRFDPDGIIISNCPLDERGHPIVDRLRVEVRGKILKGWHRIWTVILNDERGELYLRYVVE